MIFLIFHIQEYYLFVSLIYIVNRYVQKKFTKDFKKKKKHFFAILVHTF